MTPTRRKFLLGTGAAGALGLAGCLKGSKYDRVEELPRPVMGDETAPVTLDLYEDYACPHCRQWNADVKPQVVSEYIETGQVKMRFFDYPIPVSNQWSWAGAQAARAVQDEAGNDAFWRFSQGVFDNQQAIDHNVYRDLANDLDLDGDTIVDKTKDGAYRPVVEADRKRARNENIPGTPGIVIDGTLLTEGVGYGQVARTIDKSLARQS